MKNRRKLWSAMTLAGILMLSTTSCMYDTIVYPEVEVPDTLTFAEDIIPIFESNCLAASACHDTGAISPDLTAANAYNELISGSYVDTSDPQSSIIYVKISPGGSMEQYISSEERAYILAWIEDGAQNN